MVLSRGYPVSLEEAAVSQTNVRMPGSSESGSMSDNSDQSYCGDDKMSDMKGDDICRDYLRNVCKRGKRCKYRHPNPTEAKVLGRKHEYTFCHDYQNSGCRRPNCRFLHCTRDEEDYYKQAGQLPVRLQQAAALGIGVVPNELPLLKGEVPVCKDFLKGQCMRAGRCKYRHVNSPTYEPVTETKERIINGTIEPMETYTTEEVERYVSDYEAVNLAALTVATAKRRRTDDTFTAYVSYPRTGQTPVEYTWLLEENTMLRRKLEELKKQVSDLAATNEVLLEQNARFRSSKITTLTGGPPVVTVTQVLTPTITPAAAMARTNLSLHPMTVTQPHHSMTVAALATPAQITVNGNSELVVSQTSIQQINTPVTQQTMVPVSITLNSSLAPLGPLPTVSHPGNMPQVRQAVTQIGSSLSTALVSYPIMSHCVTQLPNSTLATLTQLPNSSMSTLTQIPNNSMNTLV